MQYGVLLWCDSKWSDIIFRWRANRKQTRSTSRRWLSRRGSRRARMSRRTNRFYRTTTRPKRTTSTRLNFSPSSSSPSLSPTSQQITGRPYSKHQALALFDLFTLSCLPISYLSITISSFILNYLQFFMNYFCCSTVILRQFVQDVVINNKMIRGCVIWLVLAVCLVHCSQFETLNLESVERNINLAGPYPTETIKATIHANADGIAHFSFLLPLDLDSKVNRISFGKAGKQRNVLGFHRSVYIYNGGSYANYRVKLPYNLNIDQEMEIVVQVVYLDRYVNLPQSITLSEDQRFQYEDVKYLVSPYLVQSQKANYKFARIIEFAEGGEKKGGADVVFSGSKVAPFTVEKHTVFGVNNNPQVKFTKVEKTVEVSHWGNVAITEQYSIVNTGPTLKGQFSRVTYGSRSPSEARNAFKGIEFDLPYEVWGLYYQDEVGNISTSKAYRDQSARNVHVALQPRFALLGGWKSNWQVGYNFKTDGHLFSEGQHFQLRNIKLQYALEKVIAEHFQIKIILPHGAENVRIRIGGVDYDMSLVEQTSSQGYLDFSGRPTYVIDSFVGSPKQKYLEVYYDYAVNKTYEKPISLFAIVLGFLLFTVFIKRFKLAAFQNSKIE